MDGSREVLYNSSPSGWFDASVFEDWFGKIAIPFFNGLPEPGPRIIIGDNVPSHLNINVLRQAEENDIKFIFLPPNSTHILQPLDVAVFRTLKAEWRKCLTEWKAGEGRRFTVMPKWAVPRLIQYLREMQDKWSELAIAGFCACGIYPLNPGKVINKHFTIDIEAAAMQQTLITYLEDRRAVNEVETQSRVRRRRLQVPHSVFKRRFSDHEP